MEEGRAVLGLVGSVAERENLLRYFPRTRHFTLKTVFGEIWGFKQNVSETVSSHSLVIVETTKSHKIW